jgi:hypothetical protein
VPSEAALRERAPADRGMLVLEQKLAILKAGPGQGRRNPALDVLTGRVPDERLVALQASLRAAPTAATGPTAMVMPVAAIRMAAVARAKRHAPSPWLQASTGDARPRLKLVAPPASRWSRVPWLPSLVAWVRAECLPYRWTVRSPRAHPAS